MTVTPVGLNQNVYVGQQNGTVQTVPVQNNAQTKQPVPVGQPYPNGQQVPAGQKVPVEQPYPNGQQYPTGQYPPVPNNGNYPVYYPTNNNGLNNLPQSQNTYDKDIMMNGIDFVKAAQEIGLYPVDPQTQQVVVQNPQQTQNPQQPQQQQQPQQVVAQNPQQVQSFTGNPFGQGQQVDEGLTNCLVTPEEAKAKDGAEKKFKLGPAIGTAVGFAAPFVCNKARLGKFLTKDLLLKVPVVSAGGLCVGGITEGLVASAKKLEANNAEADVTAPAKMDAKA